MDWRLLIGVTVVSWATYMVILKGIASRISPQWSLLLFVIGYSLGVVAYCLATMPAGPRRIFAGPPALAFVSGLLCALGAATYFKALPLAPGSVLVPLMGLYIPLAALGCWVMFREGFSMARLAGLICAAVAIVLLGGPAR